MMHVFIENHIYNKTSLVAENLRRNFIWLISKFM